MKYCYCKALKKLGLVLIKDGSHVKCKDKQGNIYVFSHDYLKQANDNNRFAKLTNKARWLKNKTDPEKYVEDNDDDEKEDEYVTMC